MEMSRTEAATGWGTWQVPSYLETSCSCHCPLGKGHEKFGSQLEVEPRLPHMPHRSSSSHSGLEPHPVIPGCQVPSAGELKRHKEQAGQAGVGWVLVF